MGRCSGVRRGRIARRIAARVRALYPFLGELAWEEAWSGWIAITADQYPRLLRLADGVFAALGYSGRGIAAATMMGRDLARLIGGAGETVFPVTGLRRLPFHAAAPWVVSGVVRWYGRRDRAELRGR